MSHSGSFSPDADTLHDMYDVDEKACEVIVRYLEAIEKTKLKNKTRTEASPIARDALEKVVERLTSLNPKLKADVEHFVMDSAAYGDEVIGWHVRVPGTDVYENTLAFIFEDNGFVITDWGGEFEAWEEAKYLEDPWPKIQEDGPQGSEDIYTYDFVTFFTRPFNHVNKAGRHDKVIFRLPLDPNDDPSPNDPGYWTTYAVAYLTAVERSGPQDYWRDRDYFWEMRDERAYSGELHHTDSDEDRKEWDTGEVLYKIEADLRERQGKLFLPDRDPNEEPGQPIPWLYGRAIPNPRYLTIREEPKWGDLVVYGLFAQGPLVVYEVAGPRVPMHQISRVAVQQGQAWPILKKALQIQRYNHGRTIRLWDARTPDRKTWQPVNVDATPSLGGLRVKRRRR
jgi:hypothetical protein